MPTDDSSPQPGCGHTHEIRDDDGRWILRGGEECMQMVFANLSGENFESRPPDAHAQYIAWMQEFNREAWPGRNNPFAEGRMIELAPIGGRAMDSFRFAARARKWALA